MMIVTKKKNNVDFCDLKAGDIFENANGYYFMKMYEMDNKCGKDINAFCLTTNTMSWFDSETEVHWYPNASLSLEP